MLPTLVLYTLMCLFRKVNKHLIVTTPISKEAVRERLYLGSGHFQAFRPGFKI